MEETKKEKLVYTVRELSELLGISMNNAYNMTYIEGFPVIHVGRKKLIPKAALEEWLMKAGGSQVNR